MRTTVPLILTIGRSTQELNHSKLYATCPACGRRLCKAVPGSELEQECPKCQGTVLVRVDQDGKVITQIMQARIAS